MSKREEIKDGFSSSNRKSGLVYTKILGWIDLGHACGDDAKRLKAILFEEKDRKYFPEFNDWYFPVDYFQEMVKHLRFGLDLWAGVHAPLMVRSCLSNEMKKRIALTIMKQTAWRFEAFQATTMIAKFTDSGFSGEDLVSDLLGFYRVFGTGIDPLILAMPTTKNYALSIWDHYGPIGNFKNKEFRPLLFPQPVPPKKQTPRKGYLPSWLNYIQPLNDLNENSLSNRHYDAPKNNFFPDNNRLNEELYVSLRRKPSKEDNLLRQKNFEMPSHFYINNHKLSSPDYFHSTNNF